MPPSPSPPSLHPGGNTTTPGVSRSLSSLNSARSAGQRSSRGSRPSTVRPYQPHSREDAAKREIFVDAESMKDRVRAQALKKEYDVRLYYHETGCAQRAARHPLLANLTLFVIALNIVWIAIALNIVWIAIDAEFNLEPTLATAGPQFVVMENFFCAYFGVEWMIRFLAFKYKRNCLRDSWFVLDTILLVLMVSETWVVALVAVAVGGDPANIANVAVFRIVRITRITRMARMVRLLKLMPELLILLKGISAAARPVAFTLMLLCMVTYVFGIIFRQITDGTVVGKEFFPTVVASMHTLLLFGTLLDSITFVIRPLEGESVALVVVFYFFVLLASLTIMNMLIGVLCEVVTAVAATEKEQLMVQFVKMQLFRILASVGVDASSAETPVISKEDLSRMLENPEICHTFTEFGVDVLVLVDLIDYIFTPDTTDEEETEPPEKMLTFGEFLDMILQLRGTNTATVRDIVELRKYISLWGDELLQVLQEDGRNMVSLLRSGTTQIETDGERGGSPQSPSALAESWPSFSRVRSTSQVQTLAEARSSLVRALSDVQRDSHRFVDSLPAEPKGMVSSLPMAEIRSWEEAANSELREAAAVIRGGDKRLCCWTSEEVDDMRGMLSDLLEQTSGGLGELQRLRLSGNCRAVAAEKFGACFGCS